MDAGELFHRFGALAWLLWCRRHEPGPRSLQLKPPEPWTIARPKNDDASRRRLLEEAETYLEHRWSYFNLGGIEEPELDWQFDPESGKRTPLEFFPKIDFRNPAAVGSIKNIWEKSRHHHLTVLSAAYVLTGQERFAMEVGDQLLHWVETNPFLVGANWISPLECGIRLIAWVWCERLLRTSSHYDRVFGPQSPLWKSVYQQQSFIDHAFARGSSANNHVIGEMAGQFIASAAWPWFAESGRWRGRAKAVLEKEAVLQTFPSGINREQAFGYQLFVSEFLLLSLHEARRAGISFSEPFTEIVRKMVEVIPVLTDAGGNLPRYGDGDDGMALQLCALGERRDRWLFDFARVLLDANVPASGEPSLPARLAGIASVPARSWAAPTGSAEFDDAGLYVLASERATPKEVLVLFDAGPQGYLSLAAHGHSDALSFSLSAGGRPVLVDPGTFCYHAEPMWRNYFRGTPAHNTVTVDGQNQSVAGGTFIWLRKADAKVVSWDAGRQTIVAEHGGYRRLSGSVIHRRKMELDGPALGVEDELSGKGEHLLEWRFHFAPGCDVRLEDGACEATWQGGRARLRLDSAVEWKLVRGLDGAGWYSGSFGSREPVFSLCGALRTVLPAVVRTRIEISL